ncbi:MAG: hypothetical protein ACKVOR_01700 [Flavobacteriales bacterium]
MKLKHYILVFAVSFLGSVFLASCLNEENRIPPNCYDGILNNGESGELNDAGFPYDCGGPCEPCDHCRNGRKDADFGETWIDCGGECGACPLCGNGILDAANGEIGIDCGGNCQECSALCFNGVLDGQETDVDCGSVYCDACPTCDDLEINGNEIGIDCGGVPCPNCQSSANCVNGTWQQSSELYTDCGGPDCYDCDTLFTWEKGGDVFTCLPSEITITQVSASVFEVGAVSTAGEAFGFLIDMGGGIIAAGTNEDIDETSPLHEAGYFDGAVNYLHSFSGSDMTVNFAVVRNVWTPAWTVNQNTIFVGSFDGTLMSVGGESVNITGSFKLPMDQ